MPNNLSLTTQQWVGEIQPQLNSRDIVLNLKDTYVDRDIALTIVGLNESGYVGPTGSVSLNGMSGAGDVGIDIYEMADTDTDSSNHNINLAQVDIGTKDATNYPYYFRVGAKGSNKVIQSGAVVGTNPGFIGTGELIAASNKSATVTANEVKEYVKFKKGTLGANVSGNITFTPAATTNMTTLAAQPSSGTEGTDYYSITPTGSKTGTVTGTASVTGEGYVKVGAETGSGGSASGTIATGTKLFIAKGAGSITGTNLSGTNDVAVNSTDGSNAGTNISAIVGTKATSEPTSGYYLAFDGSSTAGNQTFTFKTSNNGYLPKDWTATKSVSYSSTAATKYFPITALDGSVTGSNLSGTNDANIDSVDGSNAGINIASILTKSATEPTSGYYVAIKASSNASAQTQTFQPTTAGYAPTTFKKTRSVSYSSTETTKYFSITKATFKNSATSGKTYTDVSSSADVLLSGDYLYINEGYTPNVKISLARLVPDSYTGKTLSTTADVRTGKFAWDVDGNPIIGAMPDVSMSTGFTADNSTLTKTKYYQVSVANNGYITASNKNVTVYQGAYTIVEQDG